MWFPVTQCIADRPRRCDWELEYKRSVSTGDLHFHDQFKQTDPLGATPQMDQLQFMGEILPDGHGDARRTQPVNFDPPRRSVLLQLLEVYRSRHVLMQKQSAQSIPAALNHYTIKTSAKVSSSSGLLQVKNAYLISSWVQTFGKSSDIT